MVGDTAVGICFAAACSLPKALASASGLPLNSASVASALNSRARRRRCGWARQLGNYAPGRGSEWPQGKFGDLWMNAYFRRTRLRIVLFRMLAGRATTLPFILKTLKQ